MHIICPHCTTSYAIDLATLGAAGRTVRCSRCKEVWLARPEDATDLSVKAPVMAEASEQTDGTDAAAQWAAHARQDEGQDQDRRQAPVVDSPSISGDWPADGEGSHQAGDVEWSSVASNEQHDIAAARRDTGRGCAAF